MFFQETESVKSRFNVYAEVNMLSTHQVIKTDLTKKSGIETNDSILKVLEKVSFDSCVIFDYDNTLAEPTDSFQSLGSDQWYSKLLEYAYQLMPDQREEAKNLVITLNHAVQHQIKMQPVEDKTNRVVKVLQDINIPVMLVTARGLDIIKPTMRQLSEELNLDFSKQWPEGYLKLDVGEGIDTPIYYNGQIYCSGYDKDKCIKSFFDLIRYCPKHVVMADDKENHLTHAKKMFEERGESFDGIRYCRLDNKVKTLDLEKTTIRLFEMQDILPVNAQQAAQKLNLASLIQSTIFSSSNLLLSNNENI